MKATQKGFVVPILLLIVVALLIISGSGYYFYSKKVSNTLPASQVQPVLQSPKNISTNSTTSTDDWYDLWHKGEVDKAKVAFLKENKFGDLRTATNSIAMPTGVSYEIITYYYPGLGATGEIDRIEIYKNSSTGKILMQSISDYQGSSTPLKAGSAEVPFIDFWCGPQCVMEPPIEFSDINSDGYPDLSLLYDAANSSGMNSYTYWLFDPASEHYSCEPKVCSGYYRVENN